MAEYPVGEHMSIEELREYLSKHPDDKRALGVSGNYWDSDNPSVVADMTKDLPVDSRGHFVLGCKALGIRQNGNGVVSR